jgi:hypothetical protein
MPVALTTSMTTEYPVDIEVTSPPRFERLQLLLRIVFAAMLGWLGITAGLLVCFLYGALPLIAAIAISSIGGARYAEETAPRVWRVLTWLLQLSAFMMLLTDRFPTGEDGSARIHMRPTGTPTAGSALVRLVTSIPSGFVLSILWMVSGLLWVVAAVVVLVDTRVPRSILAFQRGVLRWQARLVAYHASLVEEYPPFSFDTAEGHGATLAVSQAR